MSRSKYKGLIQTALLLLFVALAHGCSADPADSNAAGDGDSTSPKKTDSLAPGLYTWTAADGATVPYKVSGAGETTVVFVHCWMCDRTFWDAQVPLVEQSYRVITLDLPGHGEGGNQRTDWKVASYGQDVAGLINELQLSNVILVGHSMGGPVSLKTAALAQGRVQGIIAIDTLQDAEMNTKESMFGDVAKMFQNDFAGTCNAMVGQMFVEENVDDVIEHVRKSACEQANPEAGTALIGDFGSLDLQTWFKEAGVPIRAINARGPQPTLVDTNKNYADFEVEYMDDVGHYPHMTRPDTFNEHLMRTLTELAG